MSSTGESLDTRPEQDDDDPAATDSSASADARRDELATIVDELQAENRRLRREYVRAKQGSYRRSAAALVVLGVAAVLGAVVFPVAREVLFILGAVGLFSGVLVRYLTPERFVTATVAQSIYESTAETGADLTAELGLEDVSVYVPTGREGATGVPVRLFVPQTSPFEIPDAGELTSLFVLPESDVHRGISVRPTAARLVREFEKSAGESIATDPADLASELSDGLVEQFELVDATSVESDLDARTVTLSVKGVAFADDMGFDHPVESFVGTGLAYWFDRPVTVERTERDGETVLVCRW
ncbi:hypothetical protein [Salinigranum sp. GCM10025319]|uniref:hypothetical protein n=1 Tax=Salinigranum sp. GCM10025319 TaxID=3252687 RepID=UPI0036162EFC